MQTVLISLKDLFKNGIFTPEELLRFANIADNAGQVFLGMMVLTPFISGLDKISWFLVSFGSAATFACWMISFLLTKKAGWWLLF